MSDECIFESNAAMPTTQFQGDVPPHIIGIPKLSCERFVVQIIPINPDASNGPPPETIFIDEQGIFDRGRGSLATHGSIKKAIFVLHCSLI